MNWDQIESKWVAMTQALCGEVPARGNASPPEAKMPRKSSAKPKRPFAIDRPAMRPAEMDRTELGDPKDPLKVPRH